ncbi:hypothetical protein SNE40_023533 [Patella caerulea]|uniref:Uncharacterized protein n=1 Tax=Patella caerulea TaxID=87958 RepID=A0AAN8IX38_PATCE
MKYFIVFITLALSIVNGAVIGNDLLNSLRICPIVDCAFNMMCLDAGVTTHTNYFTINGMKCAGCPTCSRLPIDVIAKREAVITTGAPIKLDPVTIQPILVAPCPRVMCAYLNNTIPCKPSEYIQNYFDWNGRRCPACVSCPTVKHD